MEAYIQGLRSLRKSSTRTIWIAVVGSPARTCFEDHEMLLVVLEILENCVGPIGVITGGKLPFDDYVARAAGLLGLHHHSFAPDTTGLDETEALRMRLSHNRPADMFESASFVVVFPREGGKEPPDPVLQYTGDLPVVGVNRKGKVSWMT